MPCLETVLQSHRRCVYACRQADLPFKELSVWRRRQCPALREPAQVSPYESLYCSCEDRAQPLRVCEVDPGTPGCQVLSRNCSQSFCERGISVSCLGPCHSRPSDPRWPPTPVPLQPDFVACGDLATHICVGTCFLNAPSRGTVLLGSSHVQWEDRHSDAQWVLIVFVSPRAAGSHTTSRSCSGQPTKTRTTRSALTSSCTSWANW